MTTVSGKLSINYAASPVIQSLYNNNKITKDDILNALFDSGEFIKYENVEYELLLNNDNGFISVPKDWDKSECPTLYSDGAEMHIKLRNGTYNVFYTPNKLDFSQRGLYSDIVEYKITEPKVNNWSCVPMSWPYTYIPERIPANALLHIQLRDKTIKTFCKPDILDFIQNNRDSDIVKYKVVKPS